MDILGFTNNLWFLISRASTQLLEWFYTPVYNDFTVLHVCFGAGIVAVLGIIIVKWFV